MMEKKLERMKELLALLKAEDEAYYLRDNPIVTDREWDAQFDELAGYYLCLLPHPERQWQTPGQPDQSRSQQTHAVGRQDQGPEGH